MTEVIENGEYTHMDYRKAKVVHLIDISKEEIFIYKGKEITKREADDIVSQHMKKRRHRGAL